VALTQDELLAEFEGMTLIQLSEFVKAFEEKFDVTAAAAAVAVAAPTGGGAAVEAAPEQDEFDEANFCQSDLECSAIEGERPVGRRRWRGWHLSRTQHVEVGLNPRGPSRKAKYSLATDSEPSSAPL
jgi:hypothetical protein